ncbi:MAG: hypothetical protein JRG97_07370 [Deltaproteobacteria bacterium]|nr:hypothetical protein [Deltaproteobacteria bacterium]MBW2050735.1 hypothetical protein [Deltaproteobacteria bacterium]MBW2140877.1 hypothetical protein [Deltaproteobacteria bacterium]MBW2322989.1 hypothetical protein [Deltaproteobacteria bacterium]
MIKHEFAASIFRYLFGLFFLAIIVIPLPALSATVSMEYSIGFNGRFPLNKWAPINIILENKGRTTNGILEIVVTAGSEYRRDVHDTVYSMDVELPTNSKKLYSFTVFIDSFTHPLIIRFRRDQKTIVYRSINLRSHYTSKGLVLILGSRIAPDFLSKLPKEFLPVVTRSKFLPETWYGYDGVKMVVLHASAWKNLREKQFTALTEWIKKGGYLVTASGLNYGAFLKERTRSLLPVNIVGFDRIFELNSMEEFCGQRLISSAPFLIVKANIEASEVIASKGDFPVIIQKDLRSGRIIFLAFDYQRPPFTDWSGRHSFWNKILTLKPSNEQIGVNLQESKILDSMISSIPKNFPSYFWAFPFLAIYVSLIYVNLYGLEKKQPQNRKYIAYLVAIIVVFSISSYGLFLYVSEQKDPSHNSFLHLKKSESKGTASSQMIVGLYSMQDKEYRINLGLKSHPVTSILPALDVGETLRSLTLHENSAGQSVMISLDRWSYRFFKFDTAVELPIRGKAFKDEQGIVIAVENMTPHLITYCQVYYNGRFFIFGDIAPDKKLVKRLDSSALEAVELFDVKELEPATSGTGSKTPGPLLKKIQKKSLKDLLLSIHSRYKSQPESLHLIGWIESAVIPIHLTNARATRQDVTLIEWEIPLDLDGKNFEIGLRPERFPYAGGTSEVNLADTGRLKRENPPHDKNRHQKGFMYSQDSHKRFITRPKVKKFKDSSCDLII